MSDFDSAASTPGVMAHRSTKRRRAYEDSGDSTPRRYSSPDELADHRPRRSPTPKSRRDSTTRRRSRSSSGSIDELSHMYKSRHRSRSRHRSHSRSSSRGSHRSSHSTPVPQSPPKYTPVSLNYKQSLILDGHKKGVAQVRYSPDGKWIASCSADGTIKIWDAMTGRHMRTMDGHLAGVSTIAWSPDSNKIASGSDDKVIRLWHRATGKPCGAPLHGHHNYVYAIAFSPKGNILVSGSYDEAVYLWDLRKRKLIRTLPAHSDPVSGIDFTRDGTLVCSCSTDGLIRVWDTATGQCLSTLVHEDNVPVTAVRFSPNGRYILANTLDSCVRLWDYFDGTCKKTYQGHTNVKFSLGSTFGDGPPGSQGFVVAGSENGEIVFWDARNKAVVQKVKGHDGVVLWVDTCSRTPERLVSCGLDGTIRIWLDEDDDMEEQLEGVNGLKLEPNEEEMDGVLRHGILDLKERFDDTSQRKSANGRGSVGARDHEERYHDLNTMEE